MFVELCFIAQGYRLENSRRRCRLAGTAAAWRFPVGATHSKVRMARHLGAIRLSTLFAETDGVMRRQMAGRGARTVRGSFEEN
jgi:hypothetical protein